MINKINLTINTKKIKNVETKSSSVSVVSSSDTTLNDLRNYYTYKYNLNDVDENDVDSREDFKMNMIQYYSNKYNINISSRSKSKN